MAIVFRLINFGALIGLGVFWYRRSLRATILGLRQRKKDRHKALEQENKMLLAEQRRVEKEKKLQEARAKIFLLLFIRGVIMLNNR